MKTRINTRLNSNNFFPQRAGELLSYSWSWIQNPFEGWQPIKNERIKLFWKASICIADTNWWGPNYNRSPSEIFSTQPNPPLKHVVNFSIIYDYYYSYISYMTIIHIFNILPLGNLETSLASTPRKKSQLWKRTTWETIVKGNVSRARLF